MTKEKKKPAKKAASKAAPAKKKSPAKPPKKVASKKPVVKKKAPAKKKPVESPNDAIAPGKISKKGDITPNHLRFVKEYVRSGFNATRSYKRVYGVTDNNVAGSAASRLLDNVKVQKILREHLEKQVKSFEISQENILAEMAKLAGGNIDDFVVINEDGTLSHDFSEMTRNQAATITELTVDEIIEADPDGKRGDLRTVKRTKLKLADKMKALKTLGDYIRISETLPTVSRKTSEILTKVKDGTLTPRDAAYEFNIAGLPIPEAIKLELAKTEIEPPDSGEGITAEELDRRFKEAKATAAGQKEVFLPARKEEVAAIKKGLEGESSFTPKEER